MTISLRSIKRLMQSSAPGRKVSNEAVKHLTTYLELRAEELAIQASRIQDRENQMRDIVGLRHKVILTRKHLEMALEGKFASSKENDHADSQH